MKYMKRRQTRRKCLLVQAYKQQFDPPGIEMQQSMIVYNFQFLTIPKVQDRTIETSKDFSNIHTCYSTQFTGQFLCNLLRSTPEQTRGNHVKEVPQVYIVTGCARPGQDTTNTICNEPIHKPSVLPSQRLLPKIWISPSTQ